MFIYFLSYNIYQFISYRKSTPNAAVNEILQISYAHAQHRCGELPHGGVADCRGASLRSDAWQGDRLHCSD